MLKFIRTSQSRKEKQEKKTYLPVMAHETDHRDLSRHIFIHKKKDVSEQKKDKTLTTHY